MPGDSLSRIVASENTATTLCRIGGSTKRTMVLCLIVACAFLVTENARAADTGADDQAAGFTLGVGLKAWYTSWERTAGSSKLKGDPVLMVGPNLQFGYHRFFLVTQALFATQDYSATHEWSNADPSMYPWTTKTDTWTRSRWDGDAILGYMFHPRFGIFAGYKDIAGDTEYLQVPNVSASLLQTYDYTFSGPGIGVTANYAWPNGVVVYANASYLSLDYKATNSVTNFTSDNSDFSMDFTGYSVEGGISYAVTNHLFLNAGYKYQTLSGTSPPPYTDVETRYTFQGLTCSVDLRL